MTSLIGCLGLSYHEFVALSIMASFFIKIWHNDIIGNKSFQGAFWKG